jgi:hypothetical protein
MTPEQANIKRNELNAAARQAKAAGDVAIAQRCRTLAITLRLIAEATHDRLRAELIARYEKDRDDLNEYLTSTGRWSPEFQKWASDPEAPSAENIST